MRQNTCVGKLCKREYRHNLSTKTTHVLTILGTLKACPIDNSNMRISSTLILASTLCMTAAGGRTPKAAPNPYFRRVGSGMS